MAIAEPKDNVMLFYVIMAVEGWAPAAEVGSCLKDLWGEITSLETFKGRQNNSPYNHLIVNRRV